MPVATNNWLWIGNRALLDPTPASSITVPQRQAIVDWVAVGAAEIRPVAVTGAYTQVGEPTANQLTTVWNAPARGVEPTSFTYQLAGQTVSPTTMISAFGVTMRVQTGTAPDVFQEQPATLIQMANGDLFFRPNPNLVSGWNSIDRVYSIQVSAVDQATTASYGAISQRVSFNPSIFDVAFPCFARGTRIATPEGDKPVEALRVRDIVLTLDNGAQPVRWVGSRSLDARLLASHPALRPVRIGAGALAPGVPACDLVVSPQHRVLVRSKIARKMFGADEVLVAARQLLLLDGIEIAEDVDSVEYFHILFDRHEVVISNGAETESLHTGPQALKAVGRAAQDEIFALFPELRDRDHVREGARVLASGRMGRRLAMRHSQHRRPLVQ